MPQVGRVIEQNSNYSDYFNVISGLTSNSRAPGGPVTIIEVEGTVVNISTSVSRSSSQ